MSLSKDEAKQMIAEKLNSLLRREKTGIVALARKMGINRTTLRTISLAKVFPNTENLNKLLQFVDISPEIKHQILIYASASDRRTPYRKQKERRFRSLSKAEKPPPEVEKEIIPEGPLPSPMTIGTVQVILDPHVVAKKLAFALILSGRADLGYLGEVKDGLRFVLTAENFKQLTGEVSDEEIADTCRLIEELRRRWAVFAQLKDKAVRDRIVAALGLDMDELFNLATLMKFELPIESVDVIEQQREYVSTLRERKGGKKR